MDHRAGPSELGRTALELLWPHAERHQGRYFGDNGGEAPNTAPNIDAARIDQQHPNTMTPAGAPAP